MSNRRRYNRLKKFAVEAGVNVYRDRNAYEFAVGGKASTKVDKARAKGVKVLTWEQFAKEYGL